MSILLCFREIVELRDFILNFALLFILLGNHNVFLIKIIENDVIICILNLFKDISMFEYWARRNKYLNNSWPDSGGRQLPI